jgi:hypothetical protein
MKHFAIVYKLHNDGSPVLIPDLTGDNAKKIILEIRKDYPKAYITSNEKGYEVLNDYGKRFEANPPTKEEAYLKWSLVKKTINKF